MSGLVKNFDTYSSCPICDSSVSEWKIKNNYRIDRCDKCGFGFVNPRPSSEFLMQYYASIGHKLGSESTAATYQELLSRETDDPSSTADAHVTIKTICSLQNKDVPRSFLDVGCGYGFFSAEAQRNGYSVDSIELAESERKIASQLLGREPAAMPFEEFPTQGNHYGVVLLSQILEHARDINFWIHKVHQLLATGGVVAIALPNFASLFRILLQEREPFITPPEHLNYFTSKNLSDLLRKHGFEVEKIQWYSRIHKNAIIRLLPRPLKAAAPTVNIVSRILLSAIDRCKLGMMLRIYARKLG